MRRLDPQSLPQHLDRLYRAAWALCGSPQDAEDLVQETCVRVLSRPRFLRGQDELAYLMQALRNTFMTQRRTAVRRPRTGTQTLDDIELPDLRTGERPEEALQAQEVIATIAGLAENQRLALVAVDIVGLSYREAADALGTREATIATRVFRAREQVARELGDGRHPPTMAESHPPTEAKPHPPTVAEPGSSAPASPARSSHGAEPRGAPRRGKLGEPGGVFSSEVSYES